MTAFVWNVFLALIWAAATEHITLGNLAIGFGVGYVVLWFLRPVIGPSNYFRKVRLGVGFVAFLFVELIRANWRVTLDVLTPRRHMRSAVVAVPLDVQTDLEITLLANLITLTPGTLSLDVSDDRRVLYIHTISLGDPAEFRRDIKDGFERRLLELLR